LADLIAQLRVHEPTGWTTNFKIPLRYCDFAAESIAQMVACPVEFDRQKPIAERDEDIATLRAWVEERIAGFDWEKLRAAAASRE
jgi:hypothetical protein